MRIFYVTEGIHITGGQLVNLDHVVTLRRMGYDAHLLTLPQPDVAQGFRPQFPPGMEAPWRTHCDDLRPDDVVVVGEMFGRGAMAVARTPARKVIHNQGPYYSFSAFLDLPAKREWGCEAIITPSHFAADMLRRMGWERPLHVVRPALDPVFAAAGEAGGPRAIRIASTANRRPVELRLIRGMLRSLRPDLNDVPWFDIRGLSRPDVARHMASSEIFLALGSLEGLGLPPLEAMAAGALVVGFRGGGGAEYATPENGDWFDDGAHFDIVARLAELIDALNAGERFEARRAAGRRTAEAFSRPAFEAALGEAWRSIAGPASTPGGRGG